ncbi:MAG TPA: hemerythrin domain-containing protein [Pseudomonadota bacterium]|jgi:hypothetical protein|nr:hemerythrin domain-containing protein [Pseudomonadota bacterium]
MKRDPRLQGLSSDHHQALVLARTLLEKQGPFSHIDPHELGHRFDVELEPHFLVEDKWLLPPLREAGLTALCDRFAKDHADLRRLISLARVGDADSAVSLGKRLHEHVRFEEREFFPACEERLSDEILSKVNQAAPHPTLHVKD